MAPSVAPSERPPGQLALIGLAALSGLLLFLSDHPVHAWPLQAVALLPLLLALERLGRAPGRGLGRAALTGLALGLAYTLPLLLVLDFPLAMGLPLALYQTLIWLLIAIGLLQALRWPGLLGPLGAGAVVVIVEYLDFTALPVWGTAQCFARVWTAAPRVVQLVSLGGVTALVLVLVSGQSLLLRLVLGPGRRRAALALLLLLGAAGAWSSWSWRRPVVGRLKVAAVGWTQADRERLGATSPEALWRRLYRPLVERAIGEGATLVVSPEVGFWLPGGMKKEEILGRVAALARERRVTLLVGLFDQARHDNRIAFFDAEGALRAEFVKTHLIPLVEKYRAGSGELAVLQLGAFRLGGMICQDDNFTDLARSYGRAGVHLVAVPTNDWLQVKDYHLENSLFRAVENRYAVVRAASNGISAIVSPRGEVLARQDHFRAGPGVIVAEVPLSGGITPYSRAGDWPVLVALALVLAGLIFRRRARRKAR